MRAEKIVNGVFSCFSAPILAASLPSRAINWQKKQGGKIENDVSPCFSPPIFAASLPDESLKRNPA